jgi:hypothetical protein
VALVAPQAAEMEEAVVRIVPLLLRRRRSSEPEAPAEACLREKRMAKVVPRAMVQTAMVPRGMARVMAPVAMGRPEKVNDRTRRSFRIGKILHGAVNRITSRSSVPDTSGRADAQLFLFGEAGLETLF